MIINPNNVKSFFSWISGELQNIDAVMYNSFRYDLPSDSYGSFEHMRKKGYLNTFDKSYSFKIYKSGEQILNKTFFSVVVVSCSINFYQ